MNKFFFCLMGLVLICSCASEPDDPHREALEQYAKSHIEDPESYQFDEIHLQFEYTYNTPLVEYRLKMQDYVEQPGVDLDALRAEDNQLQVLIDELGYAKVCNEYHLWFWCKDPATGEKQQRAVKARYDMDEIKGMSRSERRNSLWIAILLPCVISTSSSCSTVSKKNCASLCCARIRRMKKT